MPIVACKFQGRFGNNLFQYAYARAYAEKHGFEFRCDPWIGSKIFQLDDKPTGDLQLNRRNENDIIEGEGDIEIRSYCQQQKCLIYTASQVREWFKFQDWVSKELYGAPLRFNALAHRRLGDYAGYGYPIVSHESYVRKFDELDVPYFWICSEESPVIAPNLPEEFSFLPDFFCMAHCNLLLRGNSTFSWWAATLNRHGRIYSPVMDGCEGGKEHDCQFESGNHKKFCNLDFVTDLHLAP